MGFKLYRPKGLVKARVTEEDMTLPGGTPVRKGDYEILQEDGTLQLMGKDEFEAKHELQRQRREKQVTLKKKTKPATTQSRD